jgi:hypothetical protein
VDTVALGRRGLDRPVREVTACAYLSVCTDGQIVTSHGQPGAKPGVITDPGSRATAKLMRHALGRRPPQASGKDPLSAAATTSEKVSTRRSNGRFEVTLAEPCS